MNTKTVFLLVLLFGSVCNVLGAAEADTELVPRQRTGCRTPPCGVPPPPTTCTYPSFTVSNSNIATSATIACFNTNGASITALTFTEITQANAHYVGEYLQLTPNLQSLILTGPNTGNYPTFTNVTACELSGLANLKSINFRYVNISQVGQCIPSYPALESIYFNGILMNMTAFSAFYASPNVKTVYVNGNLVGSWCTPFNSLTTSLTIMGTTIDSNLLSYITQLNNLQVIILEAVYDGITATGLEFGNFLKFVPDASVKTLKLNYIALNYTFWPIITNRFPALELFEFYPIVYSVNDVNSLAVINGAKVSSGFVTLHIAAESTTLTVTDLQPLADIPYLKEFYVPGWGYSQAQTDYFNSKGSQVYLQYQPCAFPSNNTIAPICDSAANPTTGSAPATTADPTTGNPTTGNPTTGNPTSGNPTTGNPTTGNPTTKAAATTRNPTTKAATTRAATTRAATTKGATTKAATTGRLTTGRQIGNIEDENNNEGGQGVATYNSASAFGVSVAFVALVVLAAL